MCWESRNIFICGCEERKVQRPTAALCPWGQAKGSACPSFQRQTCPYTSSMFDFPCLGCTGHAAMAAVKQKKRHYSRVSLLVELLSLRGKQEER